MSIDIDSIGGRLKSLRKKRGWSQQKLAEKAGVSLIVVTKLEQHISKEPGLMTAAKLADALGISLDELVGRTSPRLKK